MVLPASISLIRLLVTPESVREATLVLSPEERERIEAFGHEDRRRNFAVGRLAARSLASGILGCPASDISLEVRSDGSVGLAGSEHHLSISHSGREVVAAMANHPIGVDIEAIRVRPVSLYRFILHPDERTLPDRLPGTDDEKITLLWSVKESVLKGRRTGLRHSPKSLGIDLEQDAGAHRTSVTVGTLAARVRTPDGPDWLVRCHAEDGHVLSVAWPAEG